MQQAITKVVTEELLDNKMNRLQKQIYIVKRVQEIKRDYRMYMSDHQTDRFPSRRELEIWRAVLREEQLLEHIKNIELVSNVHTVCPKCHKQRVRSYLFQTRSGDEAATEFSVCLECGNKWKRNG